MVYCVRYGNPLPDREFRQSEAAWRAQLTPEQYRVAREKTTERAFSSEMCNTLEPASYACVGCGAELFDSREKYQSGTGWPSFHQPVHPNAVAYHLDHSGGMERIETACNTCGAHLGHVFPDGPQPGGLRYCINAVVLHKLATGSEGTAIATFGGGCFWCTEAMFLKVQGVQSVESGYSGGTVANPGYDEVCRGETGHAEVIQVTFDPRRICYADLIRLHLSSHDPTTLNRQGADQGAQYRSVIFGHDAEQLQIASQIIDEAQTLFDKPIVTEVQPYTAFYKAENDHQNYYAENSEALYCQMVIEPKLRKFCEQLSRIVAAS